MQREIKFRAKIGTGRWIYGGGIVHLPNGNCAMLHLDAEDRVTVTMVDPKTVGQYTGLMDKHGKEIYADDIVRHHTGAIGVIEFGKYVTNNDSNEDILGWIVLLPLRAAALDPQGTWEVVGNRWDTPRLLRGRKV